MVYANLSIDGRKSVIGRQRGGVNHGTGKSGMADPAAPTLPASSALPGRLRAPTSSSFPMRGRHWRGCVTELFEGTDRYINLIRQKTKEVYSAVCLHRIIKEGSELMRAAGGMAEAARQQQLAPLTKLTETRAFIAIAQQLYPDIADEAMSIYTNGASPKYEETPEKAVHDNGFPHDPRNSK